MVEVMIRYFCKAKHRERDLCNSCSGLLQDITVRIDRCHLDEKISSCFMCPDYCYSPEMRTKIKAAMRFSAPRMLFRHPVLIFKHLRHLQKLHRHL